MSPEPQGLKPNSFQAANAALKGRSSTVVATFAVGPTSAVAPTSTIVLMSSTFTASDQIHRMTMFSFVVFGSQG